MLEIDLQTRDTESRDEQREKAGRRKRQGAESKAGRKDITTDAHRGKAGHVLEHQGRKSGMTTNQKTETAILKMLKGLVLGSRKFSNSKAIFELGADKGSIDLGAQEKREAIAIDANVIEKTHYLKDTRGARRNNG